MPIGFLIILLLRKKFPKLHQIVKPKLIVSKSMVYILTLILKKVANKILATSNWCSFSKCVLFIFTPESNKPVKPSCPIYVLKAWCQKNLRHLGQYFCPRDEDITAKAVFSYCQWLTSLSGNYYTVSGTYQLFLAACLSGSGCMIYLNTTCGLPLLLRITSLANRILSMIKRVHTTSSHTTSHRYQIIILLIIVLRNHQ